MTAPSPPTTTRDAPRRRWRLLAGALVVSLAAHFVVTLWPVAFDAAPEDAPLAVTITQMPPPPLPQPPAVQPQAKPNATPRVRKTSPLVVPDPDAPPAAVAAAAPADAPAQAAAPAAAPAAPALSETVAAAATDIPAGKKLPPRIDLVYKLYLGTQGFLIGDATYRFEYADNRYRIFTVGKPRGLAAMLVRGEGRLESRGLITREGLQPIEFSFERTDTGKREEALFDWDTGIVTLNDDKTATIDTPMFDALSIMWQYYFTPPASAGISFSLATTRRVVRYHVQREGDETLHWGAGDIATERWHRVSEDGKNNAYA
ncbi:MAG: DUF3108 domain-containing protein, partial [Proteobacteria bacterium]|nr:DUF3108 domain-containing protein [Pseudomonadota bacterium]